MFLSNTLDPMKLVAIFAGALLTSSPAAADWQYTHWGDAP